MERKIATTPLSLPRSTRRDEWRGLTSARAGVVVPIAFFPLLREDSLRGRFMAQVRMAEAVRTIINPVRVRMQAHLVAKIAMARFDGSEEVLNRSFSGQTLAGGGAAPAWDLIDTNLAGLAAEDTGHPIFDKLGIHYKKVDRISADVVESYNQIVNWRRRSVSKAISQRTLTDMNLARAFWNNIKFDHIKPSFDAAMMEGQVELAVTQPTQLVHTQGANANGARADVYVNNGGTPSKPYLYAGSVGAANAMQVSFEGTTAMVSLANLAMAKQTQVWAKVRERYQGIPDEYLIDLLMRGIRVPPEDLREPILIGYSEAVIGQTERYATDGASLDTSVTRGVAQLSMSLNTPAVGTGGLVMVTMEIIPDQLYERVQDLALVVDATGSSANVPNAMADALDPQKVETVSNKYADTLHTAPTGIFGYQPLNADWQRNFARVGGRFKRPFPDAFKEDRQRIWAVEKTDPTLTEDFYLCPTPFPHSVFADANADPFEIITIGQTAIRGLTVFGGGFEEDDDHYDKIMADIDKGRIVSGGVAAALVSEGEGVEKPEPKADESEVTE